MGDEGVKQSAKDWLLDQIGSEITEAALEKTPWWIERMMDYADHVATSIREQVTRLKDSLEILGGRADLEKMRADIAEEKVARLQSDLQQAQDELQGALVAEKAYISANNERIALLGQVARLEKERDSWRRVAERLEGEKAAAEARIRELEEKK